MTIPGDNSIPYGFSTRVDGMTVVRAGSDTPPTEFVLLRAAYNDPQSRGTVTFEIALTATAAYQLAEQLVDQARRTCGGDD